MSDIDAPSHIPRQTGEAATRVTRTSTTSDDSSAEQKSGDNRTLPPEKTTETPEKPAVHETAVTISTSLSSLEAGGRITAEYLGVDGQGRPLIASESGTYTVTYDPKEQPKIERIPRDATLEIKIFKVDRQIEARLIFQDPATKNTISLAVTLELTSLGDGPPRPRPAAGREHLPLEQQKISYQTTALFRAENIARESASKLAGLPLPAATTNYTLYEKALPQENRPAIVRTAIAGNALIAQEQAQGQTAQGQTAQEGQTATGPAGTGPAPPGESLPPVRDIQGLLNKNTLATVIKTFPAAPDNLPEIIRQQLGSVLPLMALEAGRNFTLHIDSVAIPDSRPAEAPPTKIDVTQQPPVAKSPRQVRVARAEFSGIIITPGQNILPEIPGKANVTTAAAAKSNPLYPNRYSPASSARPGPGNGYKTLYVATPVSIIKFQSPVELKAGTVINFSLPERPGQAGSRVASAGDDIAARQNIPAPESRAADRAIATPPVTRPAVPPAAPAELAPQPLETFPQNWQSLSQILSVMSVGGSSSMAQSLNNRLPGIENPARMTTGMIFFLAAIGAKTPARIWLGPDITRRLEQAGQEKLLQKLDNDMQRIFRLGTTTTAPNDWRPALLPLHIGGDVTAIPILTRQVRDDRPDGENGAEREGEDRDKTTRFIVELDLSQFGQIQLDGLLKDQKLNIIIRAGIKLPPTMKASMTDMFTTALDISGYRGDLQFRDNSPPDISVRNIINQKIHMTGV